MMTDPPVTVAISDKAFSPVLFFFFFLVVIVVGARF